MQEKLIGFLLKKGKKKTALKIFNKICQNIAYILPNISLTYIFSLFFSKLNTNIETRKVLFRNRVHFIPTPIQQMRKIFIIFKWLKIVLQNNKNKASFDKKFQHEILSVIFFENTSRVMKLKLENELKAYQYKSKIHFRWN